MVDCELRSANKAMAVLNAVVSGKQQTDSVSGADDCDKSASLFRPIDGQHENE